MTIIIKMFENLSTTGYLIIKRIVNKSETINVYPIRTRFEKQIQLLTHNILIPPPWPPLLPTNSIITTLNYFNSVGLKRETIAAQLLVYNKHILIL